MEYYHALKDTKLKAIPNYTMPSKQELCTVQTN